MNTQRKGDIALTRAISDFTELGYDVSVPISESSPYDLILDEGSELVKIQVKYWGNTKKSLDLRRIFSNSKGYNTRKYKEGDYNWLYVYSPEKGSFLVKESLAGRSAITPNETHRLNQRA